MITVFSKTVMKINPLVFPGGLIFLRGFTAIGLVVYLVHGAFYFKWQDA